MAKFQYSAIRTDGERVSGIMEGSDRSAVIHKLAEQGQHPIDVAEAETAISTARIFSFGGGAASAAEISTFTRELAWLLRAGMTLNSALEILSKETFSAGFSGLIATLRTDIRKGRSFHEALAGSGIFSRYLVSMVEVGEASGTLAQVLERVAATRDKERKLRGRLVSALTYPSLLVLLAVGAVSFILVSVVPSIKDMILGAGAPVPDSARAVIAMSDWLIANGLTLLVAAPLAALILVLVFGGPRMQELLYRMALRLPLVGSLLKKTAVIQFCRVLGTLLAAGVSLPDSLKLMRPSMGNRELAAAIGEMETALRRGEDFLVPLERTRIFPKLLARMLKVGNETGNLTPSVLQVTDILEEELERAVDRSLTLLEPAIILMLSAVVAFIIVSLMGAIISINDLTL
ncbi:MAG: type II secretion system F family protein [Hyphomicrobiales bacterium]